jgi:hypothetical protein
MQRIARGRGARTVENLLICGALRLVAGCTRNPSEPAIKADHPEVGLESGVDALNETQDAQPRTTLSVTYVRSDPSASLDPKSVPGWPADPTLGIKWRVIEKWHLNLADKEQVRLSGPASGSIYLRSRDDLPPGIKADGALVPHHLIEISYSPTEQGFGSSVWPCKPSIVLWSSGLGTKASEMLIAQCDDPWQ